MRSLLLLLCLLVATTGCIAPSGGGPVTNTTTETPITDTETGTTTPSATQATATTDSCIPYEPVAGLDLTVPEWSNTSAHLTVTTVENGTTIVNRTVTAGERVVYDGSNRVFEPRTEYRVAIRVDESVRWNRTLSPKARQNLEVERNGSVTLESMPIEDTPTPCPE